MCKILVLFTDPQSPNKIKPLFKGVNIKFLKPPKKLKEVLPPMNPEAIAVEAGCPKMIKKINELLPGVPVIYVGGTPQQIRSLPLGITIVDNWALASQNIN
jgi:hypothetical protein